MNVRNKWWIAVCILLVLLISCVYVFIPGELEVSEIELVKCNAAGAARIIYPGASLRNWWPPAATYPVPGPVMNIFPLRGVDSSILQYRYRISTSLNPLKRVMQYRETVRIGRDMMTVLSALRGFLEKKENIYGIDVQSGMSKDSTLMVTELVTLSYPGTSELYRAIGALRAYIASQGGKETNYPMMRVIKGLDGKFNTMLAVPTDRRLKGQGKFFPRLFVPWKILKGEVKGGAYTGEHALAQLQQYVQDYQRTAMAMPFQSLVTERDQEPDTSRWVTRVIQPVP